ncbi:hypothetical protein RF11_03924 [Thelohanellus kitauei]|uniref:Uncharacterized protein n=1 Tax=Thelohanellus kitauei TaxID=669202 RepID=A0A0C2NEF0_THEKT|nr:hypothetical protein RF11_03924 [Thelohanellus kitauei]
MAIFVNRLLDDKKIRDCQKHGNIKKSHEIEEINKQIEFNTKKSCVLICRTRQSELEDMKMCLNYLHIKMTEKELSESILSGYTVILYRSNQSACLAVRESLVSFIEQLPHSLLNCCVIKVYTLFFIKLACVITRVIHDIIASNPNFCELISKMLICETTLYDTFFFRTLFIGIRKHIEFYIIAQIQKTEIGRYSFAMFVLSRLRLFYSSKLKGNCTKRYLIELESQTISSPSIFLYLVENGLLCKMIDFLTSCLETIGFTRNRSNGVVSLCTDNESIDYVCMMIKKANSITTWKCYRRWYQRMFEIGDHGLRITSS